MTAAEFVPAGADLDGLRAASRDCRGCELWEPATQTVFSAGPGDARVVLVGEGLPRDSLYRTNAVKHFRFRQDGPGKRRIHQTPDMSHITACRPWLVEELRLVDPDVIVCLGATAAKALLGTAVRVTGDARPRRGDRTRHLGRVAELPDHGAPVRRTPR
jgi:DNA polymerase